MKASIGIDFGTSTTLAALLTTGAPAKIVRTTSGDEITASYVAFLPDGKVTVGKAAKNRRVIDATNTLFSFKRIVGRRWGSSEVNTFMTQYPFALERGADDVPRFVTRAGKLSPVEVTSYLLAMLRDAPDLKEHLTHAPVTMTVPVSFHDEQRSALTSAAAHAGFRTVTLLEEPCAAAVACLTAEDDNKTVAIYDLGGGTFDITIIEWHNGKFKILGLSGDSYLGGDDITAQCAEWVALQVLERFHWNVRSSESSWQRLLVICENAKVQLSFADHQDISLAGIDEVLKDKSVTLTRQHLQEISAALVRRTFTCCDEALRNAGVTANRVQRVVLSGGCGHIGFVRDAIEGYFGQKPFVQNPPDRVVALGAAMHGVAK